MFFFQLPSVGILLKQYSTNEHTDEYVRGRETPQETRKVKPGGQLRDPSSYYPGFLASFILKCIRFYLLNHT